MNPPQNFAHPDHTHSAEKLRVDLIDFGEDGVLARFTYEPGFHYAEHVTPHKGGAYEDVPPHITMCLSGRLHSILPDGTEQEMGPDDTQLVPPWHGTPRDAWVVGDEPFVAISFLPRTHPASPRAVSPDPNVA